MECQGCAAGFPLDTDGYHQRWHKGRYEIKGLCLWRQCVVLTEAPKPDLSIEIDKFLNRIKRLSYYKGK